MYFRSHLIHRETLKGRIDSVDKVQELKDQENQIDRTG
jgi:hypothetical protein